MRFRIWLNSFALLFGLFGASSGHTQTIEVTSLNRNLFLRIEGTLRLACHLPTPNGERLYGYINTVVTPNAPTQTIFNVKTLGWAVSQKKKFDKTITTLLKQISRAQRSDLPQKVAQYRTTLRLRRLARKEVAALLVACPKFLPSLSDYNYPVPTPTPSVAADECIEPSDNPFDLPTDNFGLVSLVPGPHALRFHVDPDMGDDNSISRGLSEDAPLRTIARAKQLALQASEGNRSPHHILLARGRDFAEPFGPWNFSGLSQEEPFVLGSYGDKELRRPRLTSPLVINGTLSNIIISGLEFFKPNRFPYRIDGSPNPSFNPAAPDETALTITGAVDRVLIQDSLFWYYTNGVKVTGAASTRAGQAKEITLIRNSFRDLYSHTGPSKGVSFQNTNGVVLTENVFARVGNAQFLSEYYVDANQGVGPGIVPVVDSVAAKIGPLNECYAVVRGNYFLKGPSGLDIRGFVLDQYQQLEPYTQQVEIYSNVFAELTRATFIDANAVLLRQNSFINGTHWGGILPISGADIRNASALKMYFNTFANSWSMADGDVSGDSAINIMGHADLGYHDVHNNTIRHWPGGFRVGPLLWYDYLTLPNLGGGTRNVAMNFTPRELLYHDNIIQNNDPFPMILVSQTDRGIMNMEFRRNVLWNPAAVQQEFWGFKERGTASGVDIIYQPDPPNCTPYNPADWGPDGTCTLFGGVFWYWQYCNAQCPPPVCQSILVSMSPNNKEQQANWYTGSSLWLTDPATGNVQSFETTGYVPPNKHRLSCDVLPFVGVGLPAVLSNTLGWTKWLQYANALGANDPNGDRIREVEFKEPNRDFMTFQTAASLRVWFNNQLRLVQSVDDFIHYITRPDINLPPQDMSFDPRVFGRNMSQYLIVGLNDVNPPVP